MTRAKELLDAATPLPWAPRKRSIERSRDLALAVYAVNRLPDYEAAVEALDRIIHHFNRDAIDDGILVLARLREEVTA